MSIWTHLMFLTAVTLTPGVIAGLGALLLWSYRAVFEGKNFVPPKGRYREKLDFQWVMQSAVLGGGVFGTLGLMTSCSIATGVGM